MKQQSVEQTLEINNAEIIRIDSVKSVLDYTEEFILFKLKNYMVKIVGDALTISEFTDGDAVVSGKIFSVTFLYN